MKLHHITFIFNTFDIQRLLWQFTTWHYKRGTENVTKFVSKCPVQWNTLLPSRLHCQCNVNQSPNYQIGL
jgi:hypothetical protein